MGYIRENWVDRDVQYPNRYKDQNNNVLTLTRDEGTVNEAGTLFNAAKMNNIESGVENNDLNITKLDNVTKYLTAIATTNGDYKVNITNTLAAGMVLYISFPAATGSSSNARLSIDDGANYKNIKFFDGTQTLASEIQTTYQKLYYNGTDFILLSESYSRTNTNGTYTRYKDGTMICYRKTNVGGASTNGNADGSLFYVDINLQHLFASTFYSAPNVSARVYTNSGQGYHGLWISTKYNSATTTYFSNYRIYSPTNTTMNISVEITAIGRWKA